MHTKDHCGALVDLANDTFDAARGKVILQHADTSLNGTHSTELLATQVIKDIREHNTARPLFTCEENSVPNIASCTLVV